MIKSEEQLDIIASAKALTAGQILKIDAMAGSGKTATLVMVAEELIENSICLVFNKSAQLEAVERFPDHVECRTTHSLAYQATGLSIQHKLSRPHGRYINVLGTGNEIAKHFNLEPFELGDGQKPVTAALLGLFIRNTCNKYEQSRDKNFTEEHLIQNVREYKGKNSSSLRKLVLNKAKELWKMRSDPSSSVLATHDTYLKMYQLSEPKLRYDVIYLDESQDSNDCVLDIVTKQNAKLILVGDSRQAIYCQPAGTMVKTIVDKVCKDVPIETLVEGDLVLSYDLEKHHLHKHGKPITKIGSRKFTGNLINISTDTLTTTYTEDHEAVVKLGHVNDEKYSHYLMRRNGKYRTGVVKWQSQMDGVFGVSHRASSERADAAWIIAIYDSWEEATIKEALFSYTYGIPDQCFNEKKTAWAELFWNEFTHCQTRLGQMWVDTGLLESKPLWCPSKGALTFRGAVVTSASNIRKGMLVCDLSSVPNTHGRIPLENWKPVVSVIKEQVVDLEVYSMNVDKDHTYVGDGILTHNCWRGAVNALDKVQENTITKRLTTTYRYGQDSADIAAKILDSDVQIKSFEGLVTKVGDDVIDKSKPYTILYRTNEALVLDAVNSISQGNIVNLEIDTKDFCNLLDSSIALYRGEMGKVKHEDLVAFENFEDLKDEAKNSASLTRIVNLIESNHCWKVLRTLRDHKNHTNPDIIYTTAHKSKGREWPQVQLAHDFPSHYDRDKNWVGLTTEEQNLLYVAATRAKDALNINKTIGEIYIEQPRSSGLEINIRQISVLSAGGSKQVVFNKDTGGGEMAEAALEYASQTSEQAISYLDGDMSYEDAYESGLVDELGNYNFSSKDLSPTGEDMIKVNDYESICRDLDVAELELMSYTSHH